MDSCKYNSLGRTAQRVLYNAGKPVDYFIMILEGRVSVTVGKENLVFESGPFSHFGLSALKAPSPGEGLGVMSKASSRHSVSSTLTITDGKERPPSPDGMKKSPTGSTKQPQPEQLSLSGSSGTSAFISDYTVKVVETALYLKIPRRVYLAAYRATIMERQQGHLSPDQVEANGKEFESVIKSLRSGSSVQGINRQRSFPALNHRESLPCVPVGHSKSRKRSSESQSKNSSLLGHQQRAASQSAGNGLLPYSSEEVGFGRPSVTEDTKISFSQSPPNSPSPSFDEARALRDNQTSPVSYTGSPSESSYLV